MQADATCAESVKLEFCCVRYVLTVPVLRACVYSVMRHSVFALSLTRRAWVSHTVLVDAGGMSVHPQAQIWLDARKTQKFVPDDNNIAQFRAVADQSSRYNTSSIRTVQSNKGFQASCCCRDSNTGPYVASVEDIKIPGGAGYIKARVYNPEPQASEPLPVLVYLHGGGWVMCSIETHDALCRDLAKQSNIIVVSVDYRLAPEHKFPAGLEDCYAALLWVSQNAKQLNADSSRLAIGGEHRPVCTFAS